MNRKQLLFFRAYGMLILSAVFLGVTSGVAGTSLLEMYLTFGVYVCIWLYELNRHCKLYEKTIEYEKKTR